MATGLNPDYFVTSDLESYFVDKDSGYPLSGGIITFYSQNNPSTLKPVYQISSPAPGTYIYNPLPNPCILSSVGTFQDALGNNIVPYYYPFDANGNPELYYITVYNSGGIFQFSRIGWPNNAAQNSDSGTAGEHNFIPNGQFLAHTQIVSATQPPVSTIQYGVGTVASQAIAQGGWNFVRTTGGTSIFNNSFVLLPSAGIGLDDFPRYAFNFACTSFNSSDQVRDLSIQWNGVYTFSSFDPMSTGQKYTFFFAAQSNDMNTYAMTVHMVYNFGTGGSPSAPIDVTLSTIQVGTGYNYITISIPEFPQNAGTIGTDNNDYVAITIRGPASSWNIQVTDFALLLGDVSPTEFPIQTNAEMLSGGVAGWMPKPNPDGSDLGLNLILSATGLAFDHSPIASLLTSFLTTSPIGYLLCDGSSYISSNYASDGVPYSRLGKILISNSYVPTLPMFGTGSNFANSYTYIGLTNCIRLTNNIDGAGTASADGSAPTGFTFLASALGGTNLTFFAYNNIANNILVSANSGTLSFTDGAGGTATGFTFGILNTATGYTAFQYSSGTIGCVAASSLTNTGGTAKHFNISNGTGSYNVWYFFTNETSPGGTNIQISMPSTLLSAQDVANITKEVINQLQVSSITVTGTPPASSFFTFSTNPTSAQNYYVWYTVNGVGVDPKPANKIGINVILTGTPTTAQIATATQTAINAYQFAVPNLEGVFLRGLDPAGIWDLDNAIRFSSLSTPTAATNMGTFEYSQFIAHSHVFHSFSTTGGANARPLWTGSSVDQANNTDNSGGTETRPVNVAVNYFIKY